MKKICSFLIFIMILSMTACGKSQNTQAPGTDNYQGEDQVQGGIKSEDETAKLQEEESADTSDTQPSTENTTEQPAESDDTSTTSGTGNPDDYWNGNYFDIEGYLRDNGADSVYGTDGESLFETDSNIHNYVATFYNKKWHIIVNETTITLAHVFYDENNGGRQTFDPSYTPLYDIGEAGELITVNSEGLQVREKALEQLFIIVDCIKADQNSNDPLSSSGLQYSNSPW